MLEKYLSYLSHKKFFKHISGYVGMILFQFGLFNGISTFVGYLMPMTSFEESISGTI